MNKDINNGTIQTPYRACIKQTVCAEYMNIHEKCFFSKITVGKLQNLAQSKKQAINRQLAYLEDDLLALSEDIIGGQNLISKICQIKKTLMTSLDSFRKLQ